VTALPEFTLRPYGESDLAAVRTLHALAFESLAAERHSGAQLAAHSAMTRDGAYAADLAASHLALAVQADGAVIATAGWIGVADEAGTAASARSSSTPNSPGAASPRILSATPRRVPKLPVTVASSYAPISTRYYSTANSATTRCAKARWQPAAASCCRCTSWRRLNYPVCPASTP
jgi:hypothetical protein